MTDRNAPHTRLDPADAPTRRRPPVHDRRPRHHHRSAAHHAEAPTELLGRWLIPWSAEDDAEEAIDLATRRLPPVRRPVPRAAVAPTTRIAPVEPPTRRLPPAPAPNPEPIGPPTMPAYALRVAMRAGWTSGTTRRRTWISRAALYSVLLVQILLTLRLHNTASVAEATNLMTGKAELAQLPHLSGVPALYPVLAAAVSSVVGLMGVRLLSLLFMLLCTSAVYSVTRALFNERTALCAATVFAFTESTLVLGNLATNDAPAMMLLAGATWIVVHTAQRHVALSLLAAPVAILAVAVNGAAALFLPTVVVLLLLTAGQRFGPGGALLRAALLTATTAAGGYVTGYRPTVPSLATEPMLVAAAKWAGIPLLIACTGVVLYARRGRLSEVPGSRRAIPSLRWRLALGILLAGTDLLAPLSATTEPLDGYVGYGLLFAAPMAGLGLTRIMGAHFRFPQLAITLATAILAVGLTQSGAIYTAWPDTTRLTALLSQQTPSTGHYLADTTDLPLYQLNTTTTAPQWTATSTIDYTGRPGPALTGIPGYRAAIDDGYFTLVILDSQQSTSVTRAVTAELRAKGNYRLLAVLPYTTSTGPGNFQVWHLTTPGR